MGMASVSLYPKSVLTIYGLQRRGLRRGLTLTCPTIPSKRAGCPSTGFLLQFQAEREGSSWVPRRHPGSGMPEREARGYGARRPSRLGGRPHRETAANMHGRRGRVYMWLSMRYTGSGVGPCVGEWDVEVHRRDVKTVCHPSCAGTSRLIWCIALQVSICVSSRVQRRGREFQRN